MFVIRFQLNLTIVSIVKQYFQALCIYSAAARMTYIVSVMTVDLFYVCVTGASLLVFRG